MAKLEDKDVAKMKQWREMGCTYMEIESRLAKSGTEVSLSTVYKALNPGPQKGPSYTRKPSADKHVQWKALRDKGMTLQAIAAGFGVTRQAVWQALEQMEVDATK